MNQPKPIIPPKSMPDVAGQPLEAPASGLDWVGMNNISMPLQILDEGERVSLEARADVFVDLAGSAKGIHMSRLYLLLNDFVGNQALAPNQMEHLSQLMLESQDNLSSSALISLSFNRLLNRRALLSDNHGWNAYPVQIIATRTGDQMTLEVAIEVLYSSTCPCSSALAWQLNQERFGLDFAGRSEVSIEEVQAWLANSAVPKATPHSQRSSARVLVKLANLSAETFSILTLSNLIETALQTPVQTAVKREDEQEFARLNGRNPMFCEDAARRIKTALLAEPSYADFRIRVEHMESLHAHNAVAMTAKGVKGGYISAI